MYLNQAFVDRIVNIELTEGVCMDTVTLLPSFGVDGETLYAFNPFDDEENVRIREVEMPDEASAFSIICNWSCGIFTDQDVLDCMGLNIADLDHRMGPVAYIYTLDEKEAINMNSTCYEPEDGYWGDDDEDDDETAEVSEEAIDEGWEPTLWDLPGEDGEDPYLDALYDALGLNTESIANCPQSCEGAVASQKN